MNKIVRYYFAHKMIRNGMPLKAVAMKLYCSLSTIEKDVNFLRHDVGIEKHFSDDEFFKAIKTYVQSR
jgi:hypothetical protein